LEKKYKDLEELAKLKENGVITQEEFEQEKRKILFPKKTSDRVPEEVKEIWENKFARIIIPIILIMVLLLFFGYLYYG